MEMAKVETRAFDGVRVVVHNPLSSALVASIKTYEKNLDP
jgi:hypothetical protein